MHPEFRCVMVVEKAMAHEMEAPLLNRFEKQELTTRDVLTVSEHGCCEELDRWSRLVGTIKEQAAHFGGRQAGGVTVR